MNNKNESLLELAIQAMAKKRKPHSLNKIAEEAFELKGEKMTPEKYAQFKMDFMLSGYFICCGDDKDQNKLWDLKSRQPSSLMDKDGSYLDDPYNDNEDVINNELNDELPYKAKSNFTDEFDEEDEDDDFEENELDDIEEDLLEFNDDLDEENELDEITFDEEVDDSEKDEDDEF